MNRLRDSIATPPRSRRSQYVGAALVAGLHAMILLALLTGFADGLSILQASRSARSGSILEASIYPAARRAAPPAGSSAPLPTKQATPRSDRVPTPQIAGPLSQEGNNSMPAAGATAALQAVPAPTGSATNNIVADYERHLLAHIEQFRLYPPGVERPLGTVEVGFSMDRQGLVLDAWIVQTSGFKALDREAVATVLRAQPLPAIPAELPDPINISLPIQFGPDL